jgi:hypothetical protein
MAVDAEPVDGLPMLVAAVDNGFTARISAPCRERDREQRCVSPCGSYCVLHNVPSK